MRQPTFLLAMLVRRFDGIYVNRIPVERARDRYIPSGETSGCFLRFEQVNVMIDP
jgi:hypothetical protein